ncbi:hypothetical protein COCMIDRAFT_23476 [Bipolaris oryzae ATCC 44560]|uniref:HTH araC/xylS-type domain-containing protein n=1 Tax=Bipolaris oryzae ATCC 44560 TaxID=930090 RepID=W6ZFB0_COCMI|nr:uncharacterized protein COCMIDRAFT_23476 [Bipolaris oryzae ATCC 44560]EUC48700.1 hypothetical protein COCMIDRAFT_23476 [Bipolaris oryzae ATCC 44560]
MPTYTTPTSRHRALLTRDPLSHSSFIYAVLTTHIYCRPTCPARLARRANILFFNASHEAEAAGFRACKRCKPNVAAVEDRQGQAVRRACERIEEAVGKGEEGKLRLGELSREVGFTSRYFHGVFKGRMGVTPREWVGRVVGERKRRDEEARCGVGEMGEQAWGGESFDFNDLIDFGGDAEMLNADDLTGPQDQSFTIDQELSLDANGLFQPWTGYEPAQAISGSFQTTPEVMSFGEKTMSSTSTLELDAAAMLDWDSLANMPQKQL